MRARDSAVASQVLGSILSFIVLETRSEVLRDGSIDISAEDKRC